MSVPTARIEINCLMDFDGSAHSAHDELLQHEQQLVSTLITTDTGPASHTEPMDVEYAQDSMVDHLTSVTTPLGHLISVFWFVCGFIGFQVQIGSRVKKVLSRDILWVSRIRWQCSLFDWTGLDRNGFNGSYLSHVAMALDTMRHIHHPTTFYDIVDAYTACKRRRSYLHNVLWLQDLSPTSQRAVHLATVHPLSTACTTYYNCTTIWIDLPNHETYPYDVWRTDAQLMGPVGSVDMRILTVHVVRYWTLRLLACSNARACDYGALNDIPSFARNVFDQKSTAVIEVGTSEDDSGSDIPEDVRDGMSDEESILFIDEDALDIYHGIIPRPIPPTAPRIRRTPGNSTRA
ncbi:hypothetical protein K488DRAFT_74929 [Vararia minispora EC-137]|uniref:Uncharacterized protein n=1 Tax=Vararia minispora EC-137 TaxID=1314806 RepID=A0ACB8Q5K4_9AGAM|nr:hypothetical protein K488DRAFT_74929 [Vararia minispora EC-137]